MFQPEQPQTAATAPDEQVAPGVRPRRGRVPLRSERQGSGRPRRPRHPDDDGDAVDVPLALASAEERLAGKRFDALEPHELAQLYRLMAGLRLSTPPRTTRRYRSGRRGRQIDMRRRCGPHAGPAAIRSGWHAGSDA